MNLPFKEILRELNYFEYLDGEWDYFPKKYQDMFTKYMNEHYTQSQLDGLYTDIDSILREACGMNYGKAIELCQKGKEVHEKIKDLQNDFAP